MQIPKDRLLFLIIIILLLMDGVFIGQYLASLERVRVTQSTLLAYQLNEKVINFTKIFCEKILNAGGEVSFDDRLVLENAIRDINSKPIFDQWQKFVNSNNEVEAQVELKTLLDLLINRVNY